MLCEIGRADDTHTAGQRRDGATGLTFIPDLDVHGVCRSYVVSRLRSVVIPELRVVVVVDREALAALEDVGAAFLDSHVRVRRDVCPPVAQREGTNGLKGPSRGWRWPCVARG